MFRIENIPGYYTNYHGLEFVLVKRIQQVHDLRGIRMEQCARALLASSDGW